MKSKGYTLWIVPTNKAHDKFTNLITKLAEDNYAPKFEPHITLLGEIELPEAEIIKKTKQLVSGQQPFVIKMQEIDYEDYFFRTLFVRAEKTKPLLTLHNRAKEIFNMQAIPYMPHLSLLYGDFPVEVKEKIIKDIGKDQSVEFTVNKVTLIKGGEIADWYTVNEFPF